MNKLKIWVEIFAKSLLLLIIATTALVAATYAQNSYHDYGLTAKTIALALIAVSSFFMAIFGHHALVCKPSESITATQREK